MPFSRVSVQAAFWALVAAGRVCNGRFQFTQHTIMKCKLLVITTFCLITINSSVQHCWAQTGTIRVYSTGLDDAFQPLPLNARDPHYTIIGAPAGTEATPFAPYVVGITAWRANDTNSQWVAPQTTYTLTTQDPPGYYTNRTTFELTGLDPDSAYVTFRILADNALQDVVLNGRSMGISGTTDFSTWLGPFTLTNGFAIGSNTLDFVVNNFPPSGGNACGLRVDILSSSVLAQPLLRIRVSQVELCWDTVTNAAYQLQYRSTLTTNVWVAFSTAFVPGTGGTGCSNDTVYSGEPQRFYRVIVRNLAANP